MKSFVKYSFYFACIVSIYAVVLLSNASVLHSNKKYFSPPDTSKNKDTIQLKYPFKDNSNPFSNTNDNNLYLKDPKNINTEIEYDDSTQRYYFYEKIGDSLRNSYPTYMTFEEFLNYDYDKQINQYWKERAEAESEFTQGKALIPKINVGGQVFDRIFGSSTIDIRPQGSAEMIFGVKSNRRDDPSLDVRQRRTTNFDYQQKIQLNVTAKIGDKIQLGANYNTEATFEFENKMKLEYEGKEDEIIKKIEAGNVTLPLTSTLITGSQSLFGIKTQLQFGKTTVTSVFSQQKGKTSTIEVSGGAQTNKFDLKADQYEENKHFFLSQYFRNNYEKSLANLPIINSAINITKIEVWITSIGPAVFENRNIIAFLDLGESNSSDIYNNTRWTGTPGKVLPSNSSNNLYADINPAGLRDINTAFNTLTGPINNLMSGNDFEIVENAQKLSPSEYTYNPRLGFISLNRTLNPGDVLAVAYQYTIVGDDSIYQVGEFSGGGIASPKNLMVKLLKSSSLNPNVKPMWKLMMRNIYSLGAYQVNSQDFRLNILYSNDEFGIPMGYFTETNLSGQPLIRVFNLDRLNTQLDNVPDGVFDFVDGAATAGGTIQSSTGRIFFPVLEPFGKFLRRPNGGISDPALADKYAYDALYDSTKTIAQQYPEKNRYYLSGNYKSSVGSEISLNAMNVPQGSVVVTCGGLKLAENVDYTVDYTLGRVKIINEGVLNSGNPIKISLESNSLFAMQTKTLLGAHVEHKLNRDLTLGGTILHLNERPLTQKVNVGEDPISNTIWGLDGVYQKESNLITKIVDKIPFIDTKETSKVMVSGEFAQLLPGHARAIGKDGTIYIDDFEASRSAIDLKSYGTWKLASTPQKQTESYMFPEATTNIRLPYGYNRAKFAWYVIDPLFLRNESRTPKHISDDVEQQSNHYVREVLETEVFPNKDPQTGTPINIAMFDFAYYPDEKGPYNYDVNPTAYSKGINSDGKLNSPDTRWGGVMRSIETTDFEATNVEYIEFWMMDPFIDPDGSGPQQPMADGGDLYFNLGDISEDILRDSRKCYENGLPISGDDTLNKYDTTMWGRVPRNQPLVNTFDNDPKSRDFQDIGLDGLSDIDENIFFNNYLADIATLYPSSKAYNDATKDPSSDDYHYYLGSDFDSYNTSILDRYKLYNGMEGNSPNSEHFTDGYPTTATTMPDIEDINRDNTLNMSERYFQYKVKMRPSEMVVGKNYITDILNTTVQLKNNNTASVKWYQFKIPVKSPDKTVGGISDFKSIRFMRIFMKNFHEKAILRFATLELVRTEWRKYNYSLIGTGEIIPPDNSNQTTFDLSAVNIEENGKRTPVNYILPPDIKREIMMGTTTLTRMNEQSLSLRVCNLIDGDARAIYKTCDLDVRNYKKLKMFVHAESVNVSDALRDGDLMVFIRLGTDFVNNYYEYEIPLKLTEWGATDPEKIWPEENRFEINLETLLEAKLKRNIEMRQSAGKNLSDPFVFFDGKNKVTVVGVPNLSGIKTIMVGIRNPKKSGSIAGDDGLPKCAEVWIDELRLTDMNQKGGWAATSRVTTSLADLGSLALAGTVSTAGFGSIEKKLDERSKENALSYDIATNLELGKFFSEKTNLRIPMFYDYSETFIKPQYNPLDPDIKYRDVIESYEDRKERDSLRNIIQDYTKRKSINFVNVKKNKTNTTSKPRLYDISNFDVTYAYTELTHHNYEIEYSTQKTYKGALGYNFINNPKNYSPFSKVKFISKSRSLALLRDFNFYLMPKLLSFRTDMDKQYSEQLYRNNSEAKLIIDPTYIKNFTWSRIYALKYDITKALGLEFNANNLARIDEPPGRIDKSNEDEYKKYKRAVLDTIKTLGRTTDYNHNLNVNYNVPINKIGLLNWITVNARYTANYSWQASPLAARSLGNQIENSNTRQLNGNFNMNSLYNKVPYLRKLNQKQNKNQQGKIKDFTKKENIVKDKSKLKNYKDTVKTDTVKINYAKIIFEGFVKMLLGVKSGSFTYSETFGTQLPGYRPKTYILGQDWDLMAPGTDFIFGAQRDNFGRYAADKHWLSQDTMFYGMFVTRYTSNFSARATIEPLRDLRIELTANRNYSRNLQENFRVLNDKYISSPQTVAGNFSISFLTWKTAFIKDTKAHFSPVFEDMKKYRNEIAWELANKNQNWIADGKKDFTDSVTREKYPLGYGPTSQKVLIRSFLAAYTGKSPAQVEKSLFPTIPMPNWRITYDGLIKMDFFKKFFKTFTLAHSYRSSYNMGSFNSNILYRDQNGYEWARDAINNYVQQYEIGAVSISEQFAPLFSIDMTWQNSILTKFELKKSRDVSLSLANNQLTELSSNEISVGLGYRLKNLSFSIKSGGRNKEFKSDLNIISNVAIRTNKTALRKIVEDVNQISSGQRVISINTSADYQFSQRLTIRLFFDRIISNPFVSAQFPNANTNAGISLRFSLAQ
ncbi:MAG: cell surface protein SprA [Bacteroidales bacterium]|nr:cell surface protein SprA [Bacteroidales bacterium]